MFECDGLVCTMKCAAIEILDHEIPWLRLQVHARRCHVSAWFELLGIDKVNVSRVAGELRLGAGKFKTAYFANNAAASIATYEPLTLKRPVTGLDRYGICGLLKVS